MWAGTCTRSHIILLHIKPGRGRAELGLGYVVDASGFGSSSQANRARASTLANSPGRTLYYCPRRHQGVEVGAVGG